jgi:hypothetical protein
VPDLHGTCITDPFPGIRRSRLGWAPDSRAAHTPDMFPPVRAESRHQCTRRENHGASFRRWHTANRDQEQGACGWRATGEEIRKCTSAGDGKHDCQVIGCQANDPAVVARIGDDQQDAVSMAVAGLQVQLPHQRLDVTQPRLGLDRKVPPVTDEQSIPRALVAGDCERDLATPANDGGQKGAKAGKKAGLRGVPDRVARRRAPQRQIESYGRGNKDERLVSDVGRLAKLDSADRRVRQANGRANLAFASGRPRSEPRAGPRRSHQGTASGALGPVETPITD